MTAGGLLSGVTCGKHGVLLLLRGSFEVGAGSSTACSSAGMLRFRGGAALGGASGAVEMEGLRNAKLFCSGGVPCCEGDGAGAGSAAGTAVSTMVHGSSMVLGGS